jgi:hypothetical protein
LLSLLKSSANVKDSCEIAVYCRGCKGDEPTARQIVLIIEAFCRVGGDVSVPAPDERITRIRFFTHKLRSRHGILVDDLGWRQRMSREHGPEARPRQIAVAATPCEPFLPDLFQIRVSWPSDPSAVPGDAVVGAVPPDHP